MSYNLVKKGDSVVLVKKFRDADGKVREQYITSVGVMTDAEFKDFRERCYEHPQEQRIDFCMRSGRMEEVAKDVPRRKAPVGDIREQPEKKEKRVKKEKKLKEVTRKYYPGVTYAPSTYKTHTEIMREREIEKREIKAGKPKPVPIPDYIKSKGKQIRFLSNLQEEYREDIKEYRKGIREEEIKMAPSLYGQRKEKMVIARHKSEIKAAEGMIDKIDKQKEGLR
jgi:hypothetical protein